MPGGADWGPEIEQKLRACDIFILLVSPHSLSSGYVVDKEIPIIRERQAKGEAVHFYPLLLTPTPEAGLRLVRDKNLRPRNEKPLFGYPLHERYRHMQEAADEIAEVAAEIGERTKLASGNAPPSVARAGVGAETVNDALIESDPNLSGASTLLLRDEILSAFELQDLKELFLLNFNQDLERIVAISNSPMNEIVLYILEYTKRRGSITRLLRAMRTARPNNAELIRTISTLCPNAMHDPPRNREAIEAVSRGVNRLADLHKQANTPTVVKDQISASRQEIKIVKDGLSDLSTGSGKPLIVVSYAHADEPENPAEGEVKWLSFVTDYLRPAIKHGAVDLWLDRLMPSSADWGREIEQMIRVCDIFILLVSRHSLSSDYVVDKEIAIVRERQAKGEAVHFYPLVLTPTPKIALDLLRDKNMRPRDGAPLSSYPLSERYRHMSEAADEIAGIVDQIRARRTIPGTTSVAKNLQQTTNDPIATRAFVISASGSVFLSYRRDDSAGFAGRIYDRLVRRLGRERVFFDVDSIGLGVDFVDYLSKQVSACEALVAVIGKTWLTVIDEHNRRRIDDPKDFVRIEIETALHRGIPVIPVLVDGAAMPRSDDLPERLRLLAQRQGIEISHSRFDSDARRLTSALLGRRMAVR
jgi:hypothetical protein